MLTARAVADYFLSLVDEEAGDSLSNLKLQKLVYYAQGFSLALTGKRLFDEAIEAWEHGPVNLGWINQKVAHSSRAGRTISLALLLTDQVSHIGLVLVADVFENLAVQALGVGRK